ncbi:MAG: hypothetical protein HQL80_03840 [Magnetococcales bacterium]|nr:hypothetical protein [Magnetococcales bacterium]MBF0583349.1 hypothetical protein [Magnetococcales bacterium]
MFNKKKSHFESARIAVRATKGRYRLVYEGTGRLFLNLMGGPIDGGGYATEHEAAHQAARFNARLQVILKMGGLKPGIINARAVAMVL